MMCEESKNNNLSAEKLFYLVVSVMIDLVFLNNNNEPVDALESVKILDNPEVQKELAQKGVMVASVEAQESEPRPTKSGW